MSKAKKRAKAEAPAAPASAPDYPTRISDCLPLPALARRVGLAADELLQHAIADRLEMATPAPDGRAMYLTGGAVRALIEAGGRIASDDERVMLYEGEPGLSGPLTMPPPCWITTATLYVAPVVAERFAAEHGIQQGDGGKATREASDPWARLTVDLEAGETGVATLDGKPYPLPSQAAAAMLYHLLQARGGWVSGAWMERPERGALQFTKASRVRKKIKEALPDLFCGGRDGGELIVSGGPKGYRLNL